jgi:D-glycero-alpha-D-manno-heptose-7-phosphate kinase
MIITRTPLRVSIGGGGTDLPAYYERFGSFFISAAINKYIYIALHKTFQKNFLLKYSQFEQIDDASLIKHPIVREAFKLHNLEPYLEMISAADIPAGTGLGSSGSFGVGLLRAIYALKREHISPGALAEEACHIEIDRLKEPVGKQDQYIAAHGGITCFEINTRGEVTVSPLRISNSTLHDLEDNLLMFFTGYSRSASEVLGQQTKGLQADDKKFTDNLHFIKQIGQEIKGSLERGDCQGFGRLMHEHWLHKNSQTSAISNPTINGWYELAMKNGALGGKLIGAGGGGFLLFYTTDRVTLRRAMEEAGLSEVRFAFDFEGAKQIV